MESLENRLAKFEEEFSHACEESQTMCFATRDRELQSAATLQIKSALESAAILKRELISLQEEDAANRVLCAEMILGSHLCELEMWIALKDDKPNEAWNSLVDTQMATLSAIDAHEIGSAIAYRIKGCVLIVL
jgi:hypothetical protein